jgi:hypothetical protein
LIGNDTGGTVRVLRPLRVPPYNGIPGTFRVGDYNDDGILDIGFVTRDTGTFEMFSGKPEGGGSAVDCVGATGILAFFTQSLFSTTYITKISNPMGVNLQYSWSGPNCGTWAPQEVSTSSATELATSMTWKHPHPPCAETTNHSDVTVKLTVDWMGGRIVCSYQGSESSPKGLDGVILQGPCVTTKK